MPVARIVDHAANLFLQAYAHAMPWHSSDIGIGTDAVASNDALYFIEIPSAGTYPVFHTSLPTWPTVKFQKICDFISSGLSADFKLVNAAKVPPQLPLRV